MLATNVVAPSQFSPRPSLAPASPQAVQEEERGPLDSALHWIGERFHDLKLTAEFLAMGQLFLMKDRKFARQEAQDPPLADAPQDVYREMIGYFGWQTVSASPSQPATGSSLKG